MTTHQINIVVCAFSLVGDLALAPVAAFFFGALATISFGNIFDIAMTNGEA